MLDRRREGPWLILRYFLDGLKNVRRMGFQDLGNMKMRC
jgi:hypothetical protein